MATAAAKLERHLDGVVMLLTSLKDTQHYPEWQDQHFKNVLGMIEGAKLSFREAARLVHKVKGLPFFESGKMKLLEALEHACSDAAKVTDVGMNGGKMQDYMKIHAYFTERHWAVAFDSSSDEMQKLELFTELAASLGMRCASEPTQAMLLALSMLTSKEYTAAVKYEMFKTAKKRIKAVCNHAVADPTLPYILQLPARPDSMDSKWMAHAFSGKKIAGQPPQSWNIMQTHQLYLSIPQRSSNRMSKPCSTSSMVPSAGISMTAGNPLAQLVQFMQMMQSMQGHQEEPAVEILPRKRQPLELEDAPVTPGPKAARLELISPASDAKEFPALQLARDASEFGPEKPTPPEKPAEPSKRPVAVAAILRGQVETRKATKKAEQAAAKAEKKAAQAEAKDAANAVKKAEKEKKDAATAAAKAAGSSPKDAPAASKDAAGSKISAKKATEDKWAGLPDEKARLEQRPTGCSKCRRKPGCTPSCWKK